MRGIRLTSGPRNPTLGSDPVTFRLPKPDTKLTILIDSAKPDQGEIDIGSEYEVAPEGAMRAVREVHG